KTKFLNELEPGEEIEGKIHIGEIKKRQIKNKEVEEFFVIITDHERKEKWICGIVTSYNTENGNIYGEKQGRVYSLIDSLNHAINDTPLNTEDSYTVKFETFRKNINKNVENIKIKAVQSWKPGAKAVNLEVIAAKLSKDSKSESERIKNLAEINNSIKIAYDNLKIKNSDINKKSIAFELKHLLDYDKMTRSEFKEVLKELDKL
ncbi:MAG TPA: hypothetical protein VK426_02225, partial [Methanobacterium sp.]|nr:hypothetical protein [Methanobacterium sp.]